MKSQKNSKAPTQLGSRSKSVIAPISKRQSDQASLSTDQTSSRSNARQAATRNTKSAQSKVSNIKMNPRNKHVADRRGISEIKRSEQDLQDKVSNLNLKIKALEDHLKEKDQCIAARNEEQSVLEQKVKDSELLKTNQVLMIQQLERSQIDPKTMELFQNADILKEIEDKKVEESKLADKLLDSILSDESTLNECFNILQKL